MSNLGFVAVAYTLTWTVLAALATYVVSRKRRAAQRLAELESQTGGGRQ